MKHLGIVILLTLLIGLSACNTEPTSEVAFESPLARTSPLVTPTTGAFVPTPIPSPPPDKGAITGRFVDYISGEPAMEMVIYLGELSPLGTGDSDSHVITMLPSSSPSTTTDKHGYFAFLNVEPGTYAMVMWTPVNSWVVSDPETELDILVTVKAGATTDLGEVATDLPN
ncbi:MAG TPA: hypothetical protein EYP49_16185 [Anaerolineae bacterium]|nr:hypothetical protein [Anaerolineae bacterium]